jgi:hypothetical protein
MNLSEMPSWQACGQRRSSVRSTDQVQVSAFNFNYIILLPPPRYSAVNGLVAHHNTTGTYDRALPATVSLRTEEMQTRKKSTALEQGEGYMWQNVSGKKKCLGRQPSLKIVY